MAGEQTKKRASAAAKDSKDAAQAAEEQAKKDPSKDEPDQDAPAGGEVHLEVSTRLPRRIRAGVTVTREAARVAVTEAVTKALEADRHIKVKRL
ncbi:MAG: hypothetical protein JJU06_12590 [Ectothiorhodospiraceae bacterium]|nr:hypothetical protein [Ectothiorhodospiraceae bacterium]